MAPDVGADAQVKKLLLNVITVYQRLISPLFGNRCRYYPSCSEYAKQAITKHGLLGGSMHSVKRILRCHPFHQGGYDPVL